MITDNNVHMWIFSLECVTGEKYDGMDIDEDFRNVERWGQFAMLFYGSM